MEILSWLKQSDSANSLLNTHFPSRLINYFIVYICMCSCEVKQKLVIAELELGQKIVVPLSAVDPYLVYGSSMACKLVVFVVYVASL